MSETEMLREALRQIDQDLNWFFSCGGAISREDMVGIIRDVRKRVDSGSDGVGQ